MKRTLNLQRKKGAKPIIRPFYYKQIYSTATLGAGVNSFDFFAKTEDAQERNYEGDVNIFSTGNGRIIGIYGKLIGPDNGPISVDVTETSVLEEISSLINSGEITLKVGDDICHADLLTTIIPDYSAVIVSGLDDAATTGENEGRSLQYVTSAHHQSVNMKRSNQLYIPFEPPLPVTQGQNVRIEWESNGYTGTADLDGYKLRLIISGEVHLSSTSVQRR